MRVTQMTNCRSIKYERVVDKLRSSEALRVHHELDRFDPLAHRRNASVRGSGRPDAQTNREHSRKNGKQSDLAHLSPPVHQLKTVLQPPDEKKYAGPSVRPL